MEPEFLLFLWIEKLHLIKESPPYKVHEHVGKQIPAFKTELIM